MIEVELRPEQYLLMLRTVDRQFRFATMKALNRLVLSAQARQRHHQERVFEIRQTRYWRQAVKIPKGGFAKIKSLRAIMIIDLKGNPITLPKLDIIRRQEYGGTRKPVPGRAKRLAIPSDDVKRTQRGLIRKTERPQRLKRVFFVPFKGGGKGLFRRIGSRQKGYTKVQGGQRMTLDKDPNVVFMYYLADDAQIEAVYDFYENAETEWRANWPRFFNLELEKAFRTARVRGYRG